MLTASGLRSGYGALPVLHGVDIAVGEGEVVSVLGRNGAGKTTLLRTLSGALAAQSGQISVGGLDVTRRPAFQRARAGIAYVPQGRGIFGMLTVEENLEVGTRAAVGSDTTDIRQRVFQYFPILKERSGQRAGTFSGGQQQMLAIARALCGQPKILLLDEPAEGIQPSIVHEIGTLVRRLADEQGLAVLLVEQNLDLVMSASSRCLVMDKGRIVHAIQPEDLKDEVLLKQFLAL
ncbi:ABC transporter ATP-binding protein [Tianweitania sediminis]|uniref:ABC transporter ATP-binding protein n=1 Tax=Tianweitania sediminis TaxID=1502156 RepID=A0A8J7RF58_9HYPH|nr:ABC transporter ATP-binding protein [Tianweitania sediminis]MBP0437321.1 ABC transporter ATP-binding protein [Tianweitania sediminis]